MWLFRINKSMQLMKRRKLMIRAVLCLMSAAILWTGLARAQAPPAGPAAGATQGPAHTPAVASQPKTRVAAPDKPSSVSVDGSEAMFTTMCALLAAGFEADVSAEHWSAYRGQ